MRRRSRRFAPCLLAAALVASYITAHAADETSSGDKLRILYSNRFSFNEQGVPLVTIEVTEGRRRVTITAGDGRDLWVLPDGRGGASIKEGTTWTVTLAKAAPALIREWTVVDRLAPGQDDAAAAALARWRRRGYHPRRFEIGTVFGLGGQVLDSRVVLIAVAPEPAGRGKARAHAIARRYHVTTSVHRQLVRRPRGTVIARSGRTVVRNPSVIWFAPANPRATLAVNGVVTGSGGSELRTGEETRRYFGSLYATVGSDGKLVVVNAVPADKLLAGLVPAEMFADSPPAALEAQAIAARTELLQKLGTRHLTDPFLLCSSQHCQVYAGAGHEDPRTTRAVERTRGMVLFRGGALADARYSAACGGHTEDARFIWGASADPNLVGRVDAAAASPMARRFARVTDANLQAFLAIKPSAVYCGNTRFSKGRFRWTVRIPARKLDRLVAAAYPQVGSVRTLEPLVRGVSGRIGKLRISGTRGSAVVAGDLAIRRLLGGLKSTLFAVQVIGQKNHPKAFEFHGAGFGHGVGMCQLGAVGMADRGANDTEILHHYYPGTALHRLY